MKHLYTKQTVAGTSYAKPDVVKVAGTLAAYTHLTSGAIYAEP